MTRWRRLVIEAAILLAAARVVLWLVPFRRMAWLFRLQPRQAEPAGELRARLLAEIPRAIASAARRLPGETVCFPVAIAAQSMLRRRGLGTTLFFGVGRGDEGLRLHAWLQYQEQGVVGHEHTDEFQVITRYP